MQWILCENLLTPEVFARYNPAFRGLAAQCRKPGARAQDAGKVWRSGVHQGFARQRGVQRVRSVNFRAFDLFAFIRGGEQVSGSLGLAEMPRLLAEQAADVSTDAGNLFRWRMQGVMRDEAVAAGQSPRQRLFVDLEVGGAVWLQCQRCLHAYEQPLSVRTRLEVVRSESEADAAPLDDDEADVIVGSRDFDLISQIEDELLLALPVSLRHETCPDAVEPEAVEAEKKPSPFAVLANLKTKH